MILRDRKTGKVLLAGQAMGYLRQIGKECASRSGGMKPEFTRKMPAGEGDFSSAGMQAVVGIAGIPRVGMFPVEAAVFVRALIATRHEIDHGIQCHTLRRRSGEPGAALAYSEVAERGSHSYYADNYEKNPCELVAEIDSLEYGYGFLSLHFGEDMANQLLCDYINDRIRRGLPLVPAKRDQYDDFAEALSDLEELRDASYHAHRVWPSREQAGPDDRFAAYMRERPAALAMFEFVRDGMLQDKFAAAVEKEQAGLHIEDEACPYLHKLDLADAYVELRAAYEKDGGDMARLAELTQAGYDLDDDVEY